MILLFAFGFLLFGFVAVLWLAALALRVFVVALWVVGCVLWALDRVVNWTVRALMETSPEVAIGLMAGLTLVWGWPR